MKTCYTPKSFNAEHEAIIETADAIIEEYATQGYDLTLRQLYYQFIARDFFANSDRNYNRLGRILSDARRAGRIDWKAIVDRTRNLRTFTSWNSPAEIIAACTKQYDVDYWANQPAYVEAWVEKDALIGVLETACNKWRVPYFSCRGYVSDSEAWAAGQRLRERIDDGKDVVVIHLGDHDPSGVDMTRDIGERINLFSGAEVPIRRIALNRDQIDEYSPPPNPAKTTDVRFARYAEVHGSESWELDALPPTTIASLIDDEVRGLIDLDLWRESIARRDEGRRALADAEALVAGSGE